MTVDAGLAQGILIVLGVFGVIFVCSLFKNRSIPEAISPEHLDEIRIRRESEKEVTTKWVVLFDGSSSALL